MTEKREKYEVAVRDPVLVPTWALMREQAVVLHKSGFFPKSIKTEYAALAIMLAGRELGIGPMESLRSVYIVNGQTTISSGLIGAMIWGAGHGYEIMESTDKLCRIKFWRQSGTTRTHYVHTFTHDDAVKAGLANKPIWKQYEKAMLFNRCISAGARAFMPDVIHKMYTPEEMGAPVTVSESGDVVIDVVATEIEDGEPEPAEWTKTQDWVKLWLYFKNDKGLTEDDVHKAAGVDSLKKYTGTKKELLAAVDAYIAAQIKAQPDAAPTDEEAAVQKEMQALSAGGRLAGLRED